VGQPVAVRRAGQPGPHPFPQRPPVFEFTMAVPVVSREYPLSAPLRSPRGGRSCQDRCRC
jgi:hypothetical protein